MLRLAALCGLGAVAQAAPPPSTAKAPPAAQAPTARSTGVPGAGRASPTAQGSYTFDAASSEVDYKAHTGSFKQITISQGKITVLANQARATGLGGTSSQWTLKGNVRIHAPPHGNLISTQAVVDVLNNHITQVAVTGNPAQFTQAGMVPGRIARGHANQIVYNVKDGTVQLRQNAWLSDGRNQISGPLVRYNILKDRIEATSGGAGERVHITIAPQKPGDKAAPPPAPPAAAPHPPGRSS